VRKIAKLAGEIPPQEQAGMTVEEWAARVAALKAQGERLVAQEPIGAPGGEQEAESALCAEVKP
jgi:hypothetical protein